MAEIDKNRYFFVGNGLNGIRHTTNPFKTKKLTHKVKIGTIVQFFNAKERPANDHFGAWY